MKRPFTRNEKIGLWSLAVAIIIGLGGWYIAAHQSPSVSATNQGIGTSYGQQGGQTGGIIQNASSITNLQQNASSITNTINLLTPAPLPKDPVTIAHQKIDPLRPDQTIDYFKAQVGPVLTTNKLTETNWDNKNLPPQEQTFYEYIFTGSLSSDPTSRDYYIQAITPDNSPNVSFWSMTICNPTTTFSFVFPSASVTNPAAKRTVFLNKSTFADVFKVTDNYLAETSSGDTNLFYSPWGGSRSIFETQDFSPGEHQRLYVGINNSCSNIAQNTFGFGDYYFDFINASGTREPSPKYLEDALKFSGLSQFRATTAINTIGMSGNDIQFYWWLTSKDNYQASVGYNFYTSSDNGY